MTNTRRFAIAAVIALAGCGRKAPDGAPVAIDGSSTVFPISEAVAEEFQAEESQKGGGARVTIGVSGTGGGFEKFCRGEVAVAGASRPIKPSEVKACGEKSIEFIELPVAYDGIAIVVNKDNDWVDTITIAELAILWAPEAQDKVRKWSDVRPDWPDREIHLFGAGVDSGTYDYFTKAVVGREHASRGDYTSSEDDNVLVQGVSTDPGALGFFGFAYYAENRDKLKLVPVDPGDGVAITPSEQTIVDGTYQPLSRPIFIYVSKAAAERDEVTRFVDFYLGHAGSLAAEVGYVPLPDRAYALARQRFGAREPGSVFGGAGSQVGVTVEKLLERE